MRQLTIRGFDAELSRCIQGLAAQEHISLNQAVLRLLRRGAGLGRESTGAHVVGSSLDHLIGTWNADEADEMDHAIEDLVSYHRHFDQIDGLVLVRLPVE